MLDNSLLRFILLLITILLLGWVLRALLSGWRADESQTETKPEKKSPKSLRGVYSEDEIQENIIATKRANSRHETRSEAHIQQPLESPDSAEFTHSEDSRHDITKRISQDIHVRQNSTPSRGSHRHPQRNSRPSRSRKIQL